MNTACRVADSLISRSQVGFVPSTSAGKPGELNEASRCGNGLSGIQRHPAETATLKRFIQWLVRYLSCASLRKNRWARPALLKVQKRPYEHADSDRRQKVGSDGKHGGREPRAGIRSRRLHEERCFSPMAHGANAKRKDAGNHCQWCETNERSSHEKERKHENSR